METCESCPHINEVNLEELSELMNTKSRDSFHYCEDCREAKTKMDIGEGTEEKLEFVMVCLTCLHVGCTRKRKSHAERHFTENISHNIVRGILGRLHCYACKKDIEATEETRGLISRIQSLFEQAICRSTLPAPVLRVEEKQKSPILYKSVKSSVIEKINIANELKNKEIAAKFKTIVGLENLESTRYFNSMLQCLMATIPFVHFFSSAESKGSFEFLEPKENVIRYNADKRGMKVQQFVREYFSKTSGSIDPSIVFVIICNKKKYFGNFSEQDTLDALLTLLDALIESEKEIYKEYNKMLLKASMLDNKLVPIGNIFGFSLIDKLTCAGCRSVSWTYDPALSINAALFEMTHGGEEEFTETLSSLQMYEEGEIQGRY